MLGVLTIERKIPDSDFLISAMQDKCRHRKLQDERTFYEKNCCTIKCLRAFPRTSLRKVGGSAMLSFSFSLSSSSSDSKLGSRRLMAMLWSTAVEVITSIAVSSLHRRPIFKQGNRRFQMPNILSTAERVLFRERLKLTSASTPGLRKEVARNGWQGYPWSPIRKLLISFSSKRIHILLLSKILASWVHPGHLATMLVNFILESQIPWTFNDM